jgi:lipid A 3-O-deacylase
LPAAAVAEPPHLVSFTAENDFFVGLDEHYTSGLQVAFLADVARAPEALRSAPPFRWSTDPHAVVAIGQRIYTPANSDLDVPDPRDRPYAGWIYLMTDVRTRADTVVDHVTVTAGLVGPASGGRRAQDLFHRAASNPPSRGWDTQLKNEPTLMIGYERAWPAVAELALGAQSADLALRAGATAGTPFTYAATGAVLRFGRHLPADLPTTTISLVPPRDGFRGAARFGWYAWIGADARFVARNLFIQGNTFRTSRGVSLKRYGLDGEAGIVAVWRMARVGFTLVRRSREFDGQGGADKFGQLAVSFAY